MLFGGWTFQQEGKIILFSALWKGFSLKQIFSTKNVLKILQIFATNNVLHLLNKYFNVLTSTVNLKWETGEKGNDDILQAGNLLHHDLQPANSILPTSVGSESWKLEEDVDMGGTLTIC